MWGVVASAAVSAIAEASRVQHAKAMQAPYRNWYAQPRRDDSLERMAAEHRRRMARMERETMWGARIGAALLLALMVAAVYGIAQVFGVA